MKSTGIVRPVDQLGRVVLPIELRRSLGINAEDSLEIYVEKDSIILKKYAPSCVFCGESANTAYYNGKVVCKKCAAGVIHAFDKPRED